MSTSSSCGREYLQYDLGFGVGISEARIVLIGFAVLMIAAGVAMLRQDSETRGTAPCPAAG